MKKIFLALICGVAMSAPAHAKRPSYSFFDASYLKSEADDAGSVASGVRLAFSTSLSRWLYLTAGHDMRDAEDADLNVYNTSLGFGVHSLNSKLQIFAAGTYERLEASGRDEDVARSRIYEREEGYGVLLGARLPIGKAELQADYKYENYGDLPNGQRNDEDRYRLSAMAYLTPRFALIGSYEMFEQAEDLDQWTLGLRAYFNNRHDAPRKKKQRGPVPPPPPPESAE